jgi:hypothetical protein
VREPFSGRDPFPVPDDLEGVLNRVPANLPAVSWAEPEEIRRRGHHRQRRRLASAGFAGVVAVSLGAVVAFGPTWPGASGGTLVVGAAAPSTTAPAPRTTPPDVPVEPPATMDTLAPRLDGTAPTPRPTIAARALLVADDLPGGDFRLYDVITDVPAADGRWMFSPPECAEYQKVQFKGHSRRVAVRVHTYLNAKRVQIDQTVERYPDPATAQLVMSDIRLAAALTCERYGQARRTAEGFIADDSVRYLFLTKTASGDGTYWTVIRRGSLVSILRTPTYVDQPGSVSELDGLTKKMATDLCVEDNAC